ncbi:MAG: metal ABC transporter permease [Muribaculaceae bacterium]|nr:metal ABC transporter permease [Muribaculaceae bacterium]
MLEYQFFINALIGVVLISAAAAVIGTYVVARRLVAVAGGITHSCFGGLGLGCYLGVSPMAVAGVFAVASALGVEWLSTRQRLREDSAIAVIWAVGMAIGVLFVFLTPGFVPELNSFLFGNILTISALDLWIFGAYLVVLAAFFLWQRRAIVACAFDVDFATVSHLPVHAINTTMIILVSVCIVLTIRLVGVMLLMSMLSLPQLTAEVFAHRFNRIMGISVVVSLLCSVGGLLLGTVVDVPCSALIVIVMAAAFFLARLSAGLRSRLQRRRPAPEI